MYDIDQVCFYDLEVLPGWFLAGFKFEGCYYQYVNDLTAVQKFLNWLEANKVQLFGFNSLGYDDIVLTEFEASNGCPDSAQRKSVDIIVHKVPRWTLPNSINSIDLMPVLPGRMSLKKIGVCLGHKRLQELPVAWDRHPSLDDQNVTVGYNKNDLDITEALFHNLRSQIDLRVELSRQYSIDLRSKGEAQIAEAVLLAECRSLGKEGTKKQLNEIARRYVEEEDTVAVKVPTWWKDLVVGKLPIVESIGNDIFSTRIPIDPQTERLQKGALDRTVYLGDRYYQMGVGGLHSIDGPGAWVPGEGEDLLDIDVESFYPRIMLTQGLYPRALGAMFLQIYSDIVERRLTAKRTGDKTTNEVLKIVINGTFGKTSDPYSALYDPTVTANVTVTGQLCLLALIEMLDGVANVVSANTDGISVIGSDRATLEQTVESWERLTGFDMEYTGYLALYQKDVNNYLALKTDGDLKKKGEFIDKWPDLRHTPYANIVATAVGAALKSGVSVSDTIRQCSDINQFIITQSVGGNFTTSWNGQPLGKVLRFYKSTLKIAQPIMRTPGEGDKGNAGMVSDSDGCVPLEDLPDRLPEDIDYDWYIGKAHALQDLISTPKRRGQNRCAEVMHRAGLRPCMVNPNKTRSRARVEYGKTDFSSMPPGWVMGTGTGDGLMAVCRDDVTTIHRTVTDYPTKSRAKVKKDHGFELIYGARVPLNRPCFTVEGMSLFDRYYTPAELKKVKR